MQAIFGLGVLKKCRMLFQLISHLINDETTAGRERIVRFLEERAFFVDLQNAKRDAGKNVITVVEAERFQFLRQTRGVDRAGG